MNILLTANEYISGNILPGLTALVCAGLLFRMIYEIMKIQTEEESFKTALKKSKKYIYAMIICTLITTLIKTIAAYY